MSYKFKKAYLEMFTWVEAVDGYREKAGCTVCGRKINLRACGRHALLQHEKGKKHRRNMLNYAKRKDIDTSTQPENISEEYSNETINPFDPQTSISLSSTICNEWTDFLFSETQFGRHISDSNELGSDTLENHINPHEKSSDSPENVPEKPNSDVPQTVMLNSHTRDSDAPENVPEKPNSDVPQTVMLNSHTSDSDAPENVPAKPNSDVPQTAMLNSDTRHSDASEIVSVKTISHTNYISEHFKLNSHLTRTCEPENTPEELLGRASSEGPSTASEHSLLRTGRKSNSKEFPNCAEQPCKVLENSSFLAGNNFANTDDECSKLNSNPLEHVNLNSSVTHIDASENESDEFSDDVDPKSRLSPTSERSSTPYYEDHLRSLSTCLIASSYSEIKASQIRDTPVGLESSGEETPFHEDSRYPSTPGPSVDMNQNHSADVPNGSFDGPRDTYLPRQSENREIYDNKKELPQTSSHSIDQTPPRCPCLSAQRVDSMKARLSLKRILISIFELFDDAKRDFESTCNDIVEHVQEIFQKASQNVSTVSVNVGKYVKPEHACCWHSLNSLETLLVEQSSSKGLISPGFSCPTPQQEVSVNKVHLKNEIKTALGRLADAKRDYEKMCHNILRLFEKRANKLSRKIDMVYPLVNFVNFAPETSNSLHFLNLVNTVRSIEQSSSEEVLPVTTCQTFKPVISTSEYEKYETRKMKNFSKRLIKTTENYMNTCRDIMQKMEFFVNKSSEKKTNPRYADLDNVFQGEHESSWNRLKFLNATLDAQRSSRGQEKFIRGRSSADSDDNTDQSLRCSERIKKKRKIETSDIDTHSR